MNLQDHIKQIFKEIEVYSTHALHGLAKRRCMELAELIRGTTQIMHKAPLLEAVTRKIGSIEEDARKFEGIGQSTSMSNKELDVVKRLVFVSGEADRDVATWEMARACLILGQYDQAMVEFKRSIDHRYKIVPAAKNVLRCLIGMSAIDDSIVQYQEWCRGGKFTLGQLESIRTFLQEILYKNNINKLLPKPTSSTMASEPESSEDAFIDIIAVKLSMNDDSDKQTEFMLDVAYQQGKTFNVLVPKHNETVLNYLTIGKEIDNLEMYSSSIIFTDRCLICERSAIKSGDKQGDYTVCITIIEPETTVNINNSM